MIEAASLDERIAKCERILKSNADSQVFAPLADALRSRGDLDQAFRICRQGLRMHPDYGAGRLVMARINLDRKMYDWAEQELEAAVALEGETRASEQLRVEILIAKGQFDQARKLVVKLKGLGGNPLYIQDLEDRIKKAIQKQMRSEPMLATPVVTSEQAENADEQPETVTADYTLSSALDELGAFVGVEVIVCTHRDGMVVDQRGSTEIPVDEIAAMAAEFGRIAFTPEAVAYFGEPRQVTAYTQTSTIIVFTLGRYLIALTCGIGANLGSVRLKFDEIAANFQES